MLDSGSLAVQWIVTFPLYQPAAFGCVVGEPESVGGVVSTLFTCTVSVLVLPALSVAIPFTVALPVTVMLFDVVPSTTQLAMPDDSPPPEFESLQVNVTVVCWPFVVCVA